MQRISEQSTELQEHRLGTVTLDPSGSVVAGSVGQWTLTYVVGSYGIDEGGTIKIAQRFASDWETPQFDRPTESGYTTVTTGGEAKLRLHWNPKGHVRPWMKCIVIDVFDGSLSPGDIVTITLGDHSQGSLGIRAQSFQESNHEIDVLIDPTNACLVQRLPSSPVFPIVADEPVQLVVIVPTQAVVNEPAGIFVKSEDRWGNPAPRPKDVRLLWNGESCATIDNETVVFSAAGSGRVIAEWNGQSYASNPISGHVAEPKYKKYWGDMHAQSDATVGTGTERDYFTFARDQARLDFTSHQGNDFQMTNADWRRLNDVVCEFHEDGRFVVFPGYEWSANTPAGGDRNVFYLEEGMPIIRSSHWQIPETPEDELTPAHPASELFRRLREHVDLGKVLLASHVGGRYADIRDPKYFDEEFGPLVELVSCWGVFEWLLWDALEQGYKVGVVCNSDGHKGRPGAEGPGAGDFGIASGLTCVLAESLTRNSIFPALKNRRCYGTTGPRIDLSFSIDGQPMGSVVVANGPVTATALVHGCGPLDSLTLFQHDQVIHTIRPPAFDQCQNSRRVRITWGGARMRGRGRRVVWDGSLHVTGAKIQVVEPFSFDSPADGIDDWDQQSVQFRSRTTGDLDGLDLWLDQSQAGSIKFDSKVGNLSADFSQLTADGVRKDFGGLDIHASIVRYPESISEMSLNLNWEATPIKGKTTTLFIKAIQADGHMAWSSPIYVQVH